jgi:NapC/NirT cytochrome c family, N-terminal region
MLRSLLYLGSNLISLIGVVLVTTAGILWLLLLPSLWNEQISNPYLGILQFLALPVVFFAGLVIIPIGILLHTRKRKNAGDTGPFLPRGGELRRLALFFAITSFLNVVIGSQLLYGAVSYMDTDQFCGKTCHTVMQPEHIAYSHSPHARVACVDCHIGPGASWFVKSKISGTGQLFAVMLHTYPTPIPSPVKNLRPARDTCEKCHWPQRFSGDLFFTRTHFAEDEQNSVTSTAGLMRVGGQNWKGTIGIHGAHSDAKGHMDYVSTDGKRQVIPQVTYTAPDGKATVYTAADAKLTPEQLANAEHRRMDCMDCHNRPTHIFQMPETAVDRDMAQGNISPKLPYIKKEAVAALQREYKDRDTATREIASSLSAFYQTKYPQTYTGDAEQLKNAIQGVQAIYLQNVFPEMKITWGTYPNNLGHMEFTGCFRCHDGNHASPDGRAISNDCATCHDLLAVDEKNPKILTDLGMNPGPPAARATGETK